MASSAVPYTNAASRSSIIKWLLANPLLAAGLAAMVIPTMHYVATASWSTEQGAHGPIVMAAGLWLLVRQWRGAMQYAAQPSLWRVAALFTPLLILYFFARVTQIVEIEGYLMYGLLLTVLYASVGSRPMQQLWFPLLFLMFVFPPPDTLVAAVTQPLKIAISQGAIGLLYWLGYPIAGAGVTIQVGQYQLFVAEACSGLNSLISLSAISLFYVYMRHQANWRYAALLMLAVIPVAIFANFIRVMLLILLTYYGGNEMAQGFLHQFAGITMFMTALLTMIGVDLLAEPLWTRHNARKAAHA